MRIHLLSLADMEEAKNLEGFLLVSHWLSYNKKTDTANLFLEDFTN
jgi:hypothetical protein